MSSEKFCLKWNDFERNISSAFRDIREEKEFFDITLACEDEQLQAHRVILSACSPFFKTVLRRNPHQHPLLYLKGVSFRDMQAVLNFMYHGEVNLAQEDLNSFLQVAEDLRVKGLTQNNSSSINSSHAAAPPSPPKTKAEPRSSIDLNSAASRVRLAGADADNHGAPPAKRSRATPALMTSAARGSPAAAARHTVSVTDDDDIQEVVPVKSEPSGTMGGGGEEVGSGGGPGTMAMYDDGTEEDELVGEGFDDSSYQEEYGDYGEAEQFNMSGGAQDAASGARVECPSCWKEILRTNLSKHLRVMHSQQMEPASCPECGKVFKSKYNMRDHLRSVHSVFRK